MNTESFRFQTFEKLKVKGLPFIANEAGLYIVLAPDDFEVIFTTSTTAIIDFKGKDMLYPETLLKTKFEMSDKKILYIGKASGKKQHA